MYYIAGDVTAP